MAAASRKVSKAVEEDEETVLHYSGSVRRSNLQTLLPEVSFLNLHTFTRLTPHIFLQEKHQEVLKLNIGGTSYRLKTATILKSCHRGLLYRFVFLDHKARVELTDGYLDSGEFFFERSAQLFSAIYQYYLTGVCHRPHAICLDMFVGELAYWGLTDGLYGQCCWPPPEEVETRHIEVDQFRSLKHSRARRFVWQLIEVPESSLAARLFSFVSILAVMLSNIGLVLASLPEFQVVLGDSGDLNDTSNATEVRIAHPTLEYIEACCVIWFTIEYVGKMWAAVDRCKVFRGTLNLIDLVAILPFYVEAALYIANFDVRQLDEFKGTILVIRILRVLRVIRIFKLGRYSAGLRCFARIMQASAHQLSMLVVVLITAIMFFGTFVYFLEKEEPDTKFVSIPAACWWCFGTMTTVGYGDLAPVTMLGKLLGSCTIASGILVLALPITIIVDNFMKVQEEILLEQQEDN